MTRWGLLVGLALVGAGCGTPRSLPPERPAAPAYGAVSSVHYRDFASADALAEYLRWQPGAPVLVSAYQGGPAPGLPENALATFEYALNFAPILIESTVRQAADGTLVLLHDETLDRTTTGSGSIAAHPLAALRTLYLRDPAGTPTPHRIPTLGEALAWAEGRTVLVLDPESVPREALIAAIQETNAGDRVVVVTDSFEDEEAYRSLAGEFVYSVVTGVEGGLLTGSYPNGPPRRIAFAGVGAVDPAVVAELHSWGIRARVGTYGAVDEAAARLGPAAYRPLLDAGADVLVTSDVPSAALAARSAPAD